MTSSDPKRQSGEDSSWPSDLGRGEGVQILQQPGSGVGVKLIDLVIHDTRQGLSFWADAEDAEAHGCLIYANGWDGATGRGHGHGIYVQNRAGKKRIENNVLFDQFGGGIQAFGSEKAFLDNLEIVGNTIFDSGALSRHGYEERAHHRERDVLQEGAGQQHRLSGRLHRRRDPGERLRERR